jgi:hypothetical protein
MQRTDLIDTDGENKAIRSFLRFYLNPGISIGQMRDNMAMSGWEDCWPDSLAAADWNSTLTKAEAQAWLRHLFSLEAQFAPVVVDIEVRADALPDYAHDQAGAGTGGSEVDARWEREHQALIGNPAIKVVGRLTRAAPASPLLLDRVLDVAAAAVEASADVWTGFARNDARTCIRAALEAVGVLPAPTALQPIPVQLNCPECGVAHVDEGPWATRLHKTHQCQACKHEWRPYDYPTVGVADKADTDRIEAISRAFVEGIGRGVERDGENSAHEDPALAAAYILGYDMAANPGTLVGALAEDRHLVEWLGKNFCVGTLDDFDQMTIKNSVKWEFLAPKGVSGDIREVLRAALARDEGTPA